MPATGSGPERAHEVLDRLEDVAGGRELLAVARQRAEDVELVGGAVRDIMLGRKPRELDVVVGEDAHGFADDLAQHVRDTTGERVELTHHERFGTALVSWEQGEVDIATRRTETYSSPGALPDVRPGTREQDLARRDFTVNAIAVVLAGERTGELRAAPGALDDLEQRTLRVLHDESFHDDPTRILRMARYKARLGFEVDHHTAQLAERALAGGALQTVSGTRLGAEVRLALTEADPVRALAELDRLGVLEVCEPGVCFDEHVARTALEILPDDGDPTVLLCAGMVVDMMSHLAQEGTEGAVWSFLHDLELPSGQAQRAFSAGVIANCAARALDGAETTAELLDLMDGAAVEGLALAGAMSDMEWGPGSYTRKTIEAWLAKHRHIRLHITGDDLLAAGLPEGPEIGRRLERVFAMRMNGMLEEGREAELSAALADD